MTVRTIAAIAATALAFLQPTSIRALVSNGMKASTEALQSQIEQTMGRPLAIQFGSTASLKKRIEAGEAFDVTSITTEAIDDLIAQGRLTLASRADGGRSELGIGIRAGAPPPDRRTASALKEEH